ncbi:hypothetical protein VRK_36240 [Vibrio sp. MEBiC08052]|nr:hypothetical protein VRK_36240 [Vibrio sp. MEBiC08052]
MWDLASIPCWLFYLYINHRHKSLMFTDFSVSTMQAIVS